MKIAESDKEKMVHDMHAAQKEAGARYQATLQKNIKNAGAGAADTDAIDDNAIALPPPKFFSPDEEGWTTIDMPVLSMYAGKGPYISRIVMNFPVSLPDDGCVDIALSQLVRRPTLSSLFRCA